MDSIGLDDLAAWLVPKIRAELKQRDDGSLPGERERIAAFDSCNVLLLDYLNKHETALAHAQRAANKLAQIAAWSEVSRAAGATLQRHRSEETE